MTLIKFFESRGTVTGFEIEGHTGAGRYGNDIVCAAVSSAALMAVNTITEIIGAKARVTQNDGFLSIKLSEQDAKNCRQVLEGLRLHLTELGRRYENNIKVITEV